METTTASVKSLDGLIQLYDLHSGFFRNVLAGVSDEDAHNRLGTGANHFAWIAGSLVAMRFDLAKVMGKEPVQTAGELFRDMQGGIKDGATYPQLTEYLNDWETVTPILKELLQNLSPADLDGPEPFGMPGKDLKLSDAILFCIHREAYMIGQLGLLRRQLGYDTMKYE